MNILPKKSWHVWRRENIDRVLRDEAQAKKEKEEEHLRELERERAERYALLRRKVGKPVEDGEEGKESDQESEQEKEKEKEEPLTDAEALGRFLLADITASATLSESTESSRKRTLEFMEQIQPNKRRREREAQEKEEIVKDALANRKLTMFLGQSSAELARNKPWYHSKESDQSPSERQYIKESRRKERADPMRRFLASSPELAVKEVPTTLEDREREGERLKESAPKERTSKQRKKSRNKQKPDAKEKEKLMDKLRAQRLQREQREREKTMSLLAPKDRSRSTPDSSDAMYSGYSQAYNPSLARNSSSHKRGRRDHRERESTGRHHPERRGGRDRR